MGRIACQTAETSTQYSGLVDHYRRYADWDVADKAHSTDKFFISMGLPSSLAFENGPSPCFLNCWAEIYPQSSLCKSWWWWCTLRVFIILRDCFFAFHNVTVENCFTSHCRFINFLHESSIVVLACDWHDQPSSFTLLQLARQSPGNSLENSLPMVLIYNVYLYASSTNCTIFSIVYVFSLPPSTSNT